MRKRVGLAMSVVSAGLVVAMAIALWKQGVRLAAKERACYAQGLYPHWVSMPRDVVCMALPERGRRS